MPQLAATASPNKIADLKSKFISLAMTLFYQKSAFYIHTTRAGSACWSTPSCIYTRWAVHRIAELRNMSCIPLELEMSPPDTNKPEKAVGHRSSRDLRAILWQLPPSILDIEKCCVLWCRDGLPLIRDCTIGEGPRGLGKAHKTQRDTLWMYFIS